MLQRNYQSSPGQGSSVAKRWVPPAAGTIPLVDALAPVLALLRNRGRAAHQQNYQSSPGQGSSVGVTWVPAACGAIPLVDAQLWFLHYRTSVGRYHAPAKLPEQPRARELGGKDVGPSRSGNDTAGGCPSSSSCATAEPWSSSSPAKLPEQPRARQLGGSHVCPCRMRRYTASGCPSSGSCTTAQAYHDTMLQRNYQSSPAQGSS